MEKKKVISFGKIDFYHRGRKINEVTLELNLRDWNYPNEFTVCADVWNNIKSDCVCCGQCLDEVKPFFKHNKLFNEIYELWTQYHLKQISGDTLARVEELMAN